MTREDPWEMAVNDEIARLMRSWRRIRHAMRLPQPLSLLEFAHLLASPVYWTRKVPHGDGHAVFVIPGYGASDVNYSALRYWLGRIRYQAVPSGISGNPGWFVRVLEHLGGRVEEKFRSTGRRVTLIGHSLGGLQAHSVARRSPDLVRHVVMLGAPLMFVGGPVDASVKVTSIFTPSDLPLRPDSHESHAENFKVLGSHDGLAANVRVYELLAGALRKPE
jgi:pimeloyl-ACP methyl ester carboxylesterase